MVVVVLTSTLPLGGLGYQLRSMTAAGNMVRTHRTGSSSLHSRWFLTLWQEGTAVGQINSQDKIGACGLVDSVVWSRIWLIIQDTACIREGKKRNNNVIFLYFLKNWMDWTELKRSRSETSIKSAHKNGLLLLPLWARIEAMSWLEAFGWSSGPRRQKLRRLTGVDCLATEMARSRLK